MEHCVVIGRRSPSLIDFTQVHRRQKASTRTSASVKISAARRLTSTPVASAPGAIADSAVEGVMSEVRGGVPASGLAYKFAPDPASLSGIFRHGCSFEAPRRAISAGPRFAN